MRIDEFESEKVSQCSSSSFSFPSWGAIQSPNLLFHEKSTTSWTPGRNFHSTPHDPTVVNADWAKATLVVEKRGAEASNEASSGGGLNIELPTFDLISELPGECIARMGSSDGKTAWKARKAAMEELEDVLKRCTGLLDTSKLRPLVDLLRALRDRLSDSQSNLKPVAARLIGVIMSLSDPASQPKLGKVVYGPLINSAMNDSRAIMHDACMEALRLGTAVPKVQGTGTNINAMEPFLVGLVGELDESDFKVGKKGFDDDATCFEQSNTGYHLVRTLELRMFWS